ncbi:MAG TPA: DUF6687 family protein [Vicinamibacterales bacterium]|jgi:hypothetical protein|nr:DUF6687 family protein [Vicinamibacterales bacterium]
MHFAPYGEINGTPNIIVDGPANMSTVIALSHWARSGTPNELKADTSTEIVFNYLDRPRFHVSAETVSNNHFDEDGLLGIFALINPVVGTRHRERLIDASRAGDFGVYKDREAARIAFVLQTCQSRGCSPLSDAIYDLPRGEQTAALYNEALELLPELLKTPERFEQYWREEDEKLSETERLIEAGTITLHEEPDLDLVVVRQDPGTPRYHAYAVHSRSVCTRVVLVQEGRLELQYRYESWVQMATRRPALRVDLSRVADALNRQERGTGRWVFDPVDSIEPRFYFNGDDFPAVSPGRALEAIRTELRTGPVALNPYD